MFMDFITRLYESDYFIICLFSVIAILVFTFIIIAVAGKKNKEKVDEFNTNLNDTSQIPTDNVAFADTTPPATPLEVPVEPIVVAEPITDVSVADSPPIYESPDKTMDFSDVNISLTDENPEPTLTSLENEEPVNTEIEQETPKIEEGGFNFDSVFEPVTPQAPMNPFENVVQSVGVEPEPVFQNSFPEPEPTPIEEPQPEEEPYNPALENTAKINIGEQFSSVFVESPETTETPIFQPEPEPEPQPEMEPVLTPDPQPTIDDIELPKMADEEPTENATQYENSFNVTLEEEKPVESIFPNIDNKEQ